MKTFAATMIDSRDAFRGYLVGHIDPGVIRSVQIGLSGVVAVQRVYRVVFHALGGV